MCPLPSHIFHIYFSQSLSLLFLISFLDQLRASEYLAARKETHMSCNGCRVLRKGCSDNCMLRQCLQWIDSPQSQAHATVFVAKFFGRAGLMSFISSVPDHQRPGLFQSLLYEAVGRTVNPVNGAVGLMWTGKWHICQSGVETVLRGGTLSPLSESRSPDSISECYKRSAFVGHTQPKRRPVNEPEEEDETPTWPDLSLRLVKRRAETPVEENYSDTTTLGSSSSADHFDSGALCGSGAKKALSLFV